MPHQRQSVHANTKVQGICLENETTVFGKKKKKQLICIAKCWKTNQM